jgi:hypothetical protein
MMTARLGVHLLWGVLAMLATSAAAQTPGGPRDPAQAQACLRLETQLATLDRGMADPARADQIKRHEDAINRQQVELDRTVAQSRRMGCEGSGFFLFGGGQPPQCGDINNQIQRMRANLDRIMAELQRLQGGGVERGEQRRAILSALADNDCGPQYRAAAPPPSGLRGFFDSLFGGPGGAVGAAAPAAVPGAAPEALQSSTYRTLCVRTCDGFYFPISFATVPARFPDDERACQRMCPATEAMLFTHRNPGEDVSQAVSLSGKPYSLLPTAFRYRQEFSPACSCKHPGETWTQALGQADSTLERGDIVVTDETSKAMAMPRPEVTKASRQDTRKTRTDRAAAGDGGSGPVAPGPPADATSADVPSSDSGGKRAVRSVGPQFLPAQ